MYVSNNLGCAMKTVGPEEVSYISEQLGNILTARCINTY